MGKKLSILLLAVVVLLSACSSASEVDDNDKEEINVTDTSGRLTAVSVESSSDDGNVADNTIDGFSDTRWSSEGDGEYVIYDLGKEMNLAYVAMAFYKGDIRHTDFDLEVSSDGSAWQQVYSGSNEVKPTVDLIKVDIEDVTARYVKLTGHGYEHNDGSKTGPWNSIVEVQFYGSDDVAVEALTLSEQPIEITYTQPGLINEDGTVHEIHIPNPVTGKTIDVAGDVDLAESDTDDSIVIQAAIDGASDGDEVFLAAGTYDLYETLYLKSGVNLRGEAGTVLMSKPTAGEYPVNVIRSQGSHDILISDMTITSAFDGALTTDHKNNNPEADGPKYVVRIEDSGSNKPSYNITVDGLTIEKYQTMGVRIANSHDVTVTGCTFRNATDLGGGGAGYGVSIQGEGNNIDRLGYSNDTRFNVVENCTFEGPYLRHGTLIQYYAHNNLVTDNTYKQIKLDAIDLHGEDEYLNEIRNNTISDIETGAGIGVGNTGANHDASGPGNWIHGNTIINAREGIKVHMGSPDTLIENNVISGATVANAKGLYLQNAPGTIVRTNLIKANDAINFWAIVFNADGGDEGRGEGIPQNVLVEDNIFDKLPGGIKITAGEEIVFQNNQYNNIDSIHIFDTRKYDYEADLIPSQVLSLVNWKINLPVENAKQIKQPALKTFEDERFFFVNETNDGVVFNAPCQADGTDATTKNSKYPRSELREMAYGGMAEADWDTDNGKHVMTIDQMITSTPEVKPHVVVGQIHDADDDVVMIRLEGSRLFVEAEGVDLGALDTDYKLGTRFTVKITAENDVIEVDYNGETMVTYDVHKEGCYFKAGMYTQSNVDKGDKPEAYGEVVIYDLNVEHTGVEQAFVQDYTNAEIPSSPAAVSLPVAMDTYIDMMKVDGIITPNVSPRIADDKLMIKTSGGQTTIRLTFLEFDLSGFSERPKAAELNLTTKDVNGTSDILIYGFEKSFGETLVWGDLYTDESRISKNNSEVMDYLNHFGQLTGEVTIKPKDPTKAVEDKDRYKANVSSFISESTSDVITLVMVEPLGVDVNLQMHSVESDPAYAPFLNLWTESGTAPVALDKGDEGQSDNNSGDGADSDSGSGSSNSGEEMNDVLQKSLDVVDVDEALNLLSYEVLKFNGQTIDLPTVIGKDVKISWSSSDDSIIDGSGNIKGDSGMDVTVTATLTKAEEETEKTFIIVIP